MLHPVNVKADGMLFNFLERCFIMFISASHSQDRRGSEKPCFRARVQQLGTGSCLIGHIDSEATGKSMGSQGLEQGIFL